MFPKSRLALIGLGVSLVVAAGWLVRSRNVSTAVQLHASEPGTAQAAASAPVASDPAPAPARESSAPTTAQSTAVSPSAARPLTFGEHGPVKLEDVPEGRFRRELAALPPAAREQALAQLGKLRVPLNDVASLQVDRDGVLFYQCPAPTPEQLASALVDTPAAQDSKSAAAGKVPQAAAVPISSPPIRHSRPGASKVIYLDFDGHTVTGTAWNEQKGSVGDEGYRPAVSTYVAKPFDTDGDATMFSDTEQTTILAIWGRMAEDYAPFDVDVTTELPASFNSNTGRVVFTPDIDANNVALPSSATAGGVAYLDTFGRFNYVSRYSPAFVYIDSFNGQGPPMAVAASHEMGHNMGLSHDGTTSEEYYEGHEGGGVQAWGPLMGAPYNMTITQWSKGEYYDANNTEDDLAIISGKLGYRPDDHADSNGAATALNASGGTLTGAGIIGMTGEADRFSFTAGAGTVQFNVEGRPLPGSYYGTDLDVALELYDSTGALVAQADDPSVVIQSISANVAGGTYYLRVKPVGAGTPQANPPSGYTVYGSLGAYEITGTLSEVGSSPPSISQHPASLSVEAGQSAGFSAQAANATSYRWQRLPGAGGGWSDMVDGGGYSGTATTNLSIAGATVAMNGDQFRLVAANANGSATSNPATLSVSVLTPPVITINPSNRGTLAGRSVNFTVNASGTAPFSYLWQRLAVGSGDWADLTSGGGYSGFTSNTLTINNPTQAMNGDQFRCVVSNGLGSATSNPALLTIGVLPTFSVRPLSKLAITGQSVTFTAAAAGGTTYQWKRNGQVVANTAGSSYTIPNVALGDDGYYELAVSNGVGSNSTYFYLHVAIPNGAVVAWGANQYGQSKVPYGLGNAAAISGEWHNLTLRTDGTVVAWGGSPLPSALDVPAGLADVVEVSAGNGFSLALKSDGTVVAWGDNYSGRTTVPAGLSDVIAIAAGGTFSVALKADGTVTAWGYGGFNNTLITVPAGLSDVVAIDTGQDATVALKSDGTLVAWGNYISGGLLPVPSSLTDVVKIACGSSSVVALKRDGTLVSWGGGTIPSLPSGLSGVADIAAGFGHGLARKSDGTLVAWGSNGSGQTNIPASITNAVGVYAGNEHSLAIVPAVAPTVTQNPISGSVTAGSMINLSVTVAGPGPFLYVWTKDGVTLSNGGRISGATSANLQIVDAQSTDAGVYRVTVTNMAGTVMSSSATIGVLTKPAISARPRSQSVVAGGTLQASVTAAGGDLTYQWRRNGEVIPGATASTLTQTNLKYADAGYYEVLVTNSIGGIATSVFKVDVAPNLPTTLVAWGSSANLVQAPASGIKALGGTAVLKTDNTAAVLWGGPPPPAGLANLVAVSGYTHYLALKADGTVAAWGNNNHGECDVPVGLNDVVAVSAGMAHSVVLKADGTVVAWGWNFYGQCDVPANLIDVVAVAAGNSQTVAIKSDGTVIAWGQNSFGAAPGNTGITNAKAVSAGWLHNSVLRRDGTVTGFGSGNDSGQLNVPAGLTNVVAVADAMGGLFSMALKADGTLVRWGSVFNLAPIPVNLAGVVAMVPSDTSIALTVPVAPPVFLQHPSSQTVLDGATVVLSAEAEGSPEVNYQWYFNGFYIAGATGSSYTIPAVSVANAGDYMVTASNSQGAVMSHTATLTVTVPPRPALFNAAGYLAHNGDVAGVIGDVSDKFDRAWAHYYQYGIFEGRSDGDFNVTAYIAQYPDVGSSLKAAALHWYTIGRPQGLRIPAGFDVAGYLARNLDIAALFSQDKYGAWLHYYNYGLFEGRSFDANFIPAEYLELNTDVKAVFGPNWQAAVMHWFNYGHPIEDRMGRVPIGFNVDSYLARYPDLAAAFGSITPTAVRNVTVWHHYLAHGTLEGRSDGDFEANHYLNTNPDLVAVVGHDLQAAALHWYFYGRREGRRIPGGFNVQNYRSLYPDVVLVFGDDLYGSWIHYRDNGVFEGRIYDDLFRPADYLSLNPDVAAAIGTNYRDALLHWLYYGQYEGRHAKN